MYGMYATILDRLYTWRDLLYDKENYILLIAFDSRSSFSVIKVELFILVLSCVLAVVSWARGFVKVPVGPAYRI